MQKFFIVLSALVILTGCGGGSKDDKSNAATLKTKLDSLKKSKAKLEDEIKSVQDQLAKADPSSVQATAKLVSADPVRKLDFFNHYIELQGKIDAEGIAYVAPKGMGGLVKSIYVKAGQQVGKGQLLLRLDDALAQQQLTTAEQQTGQLKARLNQAQTVLDRTQNLWKQGIGMEINVINARADVEALTAQLKAAQGQVGMAQEQVNMTNVYAEMSGMVDVMSVKVGQIFSPQTAADPRAGSYIRIVNNSNLKVVTNVPDNYAAIIKKGASVLIKVDEAGKDSIPSVISMVGSYIDPTTRSFTVEAKLSSDPSLKPNETAVMKILDYQAKDAVVIPVRALLSDDKGKYVFIMVNEGGKNVARKKAVTVDDKHVSSDQLQVLSGLSAGDMIITEGSEAVYDGQTITTGK
jgi:membrane fusion protein, multidrug efflux system